MGKANGRFFPLWILLGKFLATFCSDPELTTSGAFVNSSSSNSSSGSVTPTSLPATSTAEWLSNYTDIVSRFSLRTADIPDDDMCYIVAGSPDTIRECEFNAQTQTFVIIHGWTITGMFESWVPKLVSALYERVPSANVIVVDWLTRANQHYSTSAAYTKLVGRDVAKFVTWIQKELELPWDKIHLVGYSLGAHVAGIAGDLTNHKISRITGLDPAGPMFENADEQDTLSKDDAQFVDVLHTYTRGSPDRSIGIKKAVGHIDVYPNGGTFQPGCGVTNTLILIAQAGIGGLREADQLVKCSHERSIHLFIDSLLNTQQQSMIGFRCHSREAFDKGLCLSCRKNRCNKIGYNINKSRMTRGAQMYLKTRGMTPYKVFHYQVKMHLFSKEIRNFSDQPIKISLYGTDGEKEDIAFVLPNMNGNSTLSLLVTTDVSIGDLMIVKLLWEKVNPFNPSDWFGRNKFYVRKIRVKSGEAQSKVIFSAKEAEFTNLIRGGEAAVFVKSKEDNRSRKEKRMHKLKMEGSLFGQNDA
ncbi:lipoprotein lipase [Stigmatopora argus]